MADEEISFRDKLRSISFTYGGKGGYGTREQFHDMPSVAQRERDHVAELRKAGVDFERA